MNHHVCNLNTFPRSIFVLLQMQVATLHVSLISDLSLPITPIGMFNLAQRGHLIFGVPRRPHVDKVIMQVIFCWLPFWNPASVERSFVWSNRNLSSNNHRRHWLRFGQVCEEGRKFVGRRAIGQWQK